MKKNKYFFKFLLFLPTSILFFSGCTKLIDNSTTVEVPVYPVTVTSSDDSPRCTCEQAQEIGITNSKNQTLEITYRYYKTRTGSTDAPATEAKTIVLPPNGYEYIGCSIGDTNTSPQCIFEYDYVVETTKGFGRTSILMSDFGYRATSSISYCMESCNRGDASCLPLGKGASKISMPLIGLFEESISTGENSVDATKVRSSYDLSADPCERENINILADNKVQNSGSGVCYITAGESTLKKLNITSEESSLVNSMSLFLPEKVEARRPTSEFFKSAKQYKEMLVFNDDMKTGIIKFGEGENELNETYGGWIQEMAKTDAHLIYSTTYGCMSSPL